MFSLWVTLNIALQLNDSSNDNMVVASILSDETSLIVILASHRNCNSLDSLIGEKSTRKSVLPEIIFFVAWSRSGWNFNNYLRDFPGEPLGRAVFTKRGKEKRKRKRRKECVLCRFYFLVRAVPHFHFDIGVGRKKLRLNRPCFMVETCLF